MCPYRLIDLEGNMRSLYLSSLSVNLRCLEDLKDVQEHSSGEEKSGNESSSSSGASSCLRAAAGGEKRKLPMPKRASSSTTAASTNDDWQALRHVTSNSQQLLQIWSSWT